MELWEGLFRETDKLIDHLVPKAEREDSVILTVNSKIKIPAHAWHPQNRSATMKALADHLSQDGQLEQFNVEQAETPAQGTCPVCGWIHDPAFTALRIDDGEAILLSGVLPEIVRLVHQAHEKGLSALSTKNELLVRTCGGYQNPCKAFDDLNRRKEYKCLFDTRRRGFISLRGAVGRNRNKSEPRSE
jgi:hypothetical protein